MEIGVERLMLEVAACHDNEKKRVWSVLSILNLYY